MNTYKELVQAINENNRTNEGSWNDWTCSKHVQDIYGDLIEDERAMGEYLLDFNIRTRGSHVEDTLNIMDIYNYGQVFVGNEI